MTSRFFQTPSVRGWTAVDGAFEHTYTIPVGWQISPNCKSTDVSCKVHVWRKWLKTIDDPSVDSHTTAWLSEMRLTGRAEPESHPTSHRYYGHELCVLNVFEMCRRFSLGFTVSMMHITYHKAIERTYGTSFSITKSVHFLAITSNCK